jgi:hypothetical protein
VVTVAPRRPRIEFRADDPTLTPNGGLALVAETCRVLDVIGTIERHVGPIKARRRGPGPPSGGDRAPAEQWRRGDCVVDEFAGGPMDGAGECD